MVLSLDESYLFSIKLFDLLDLVDVFEVVLLEGDNLLSQTHVLLPLLL